jgi:predicted RNase H-like nuclease
VTPPGTPGARVCGIDGCRGGWVVATVPVDGAGPYVVERVADLADVFGRLESGYLDAVAIDMPIGLSSSDRRSCDIDARRIVGPRRSSVFPAPPRSVLGARTYDEATARCRVASGRGMSRQVFGILPKIEEVDRLVSPARQDRVVEVHPEVSFAVLAGHPMSRPKRTVDGSSQRRAALRGTFGDIDAEIDRRVPGARPDDVVDALVAAWSATRLALGTAVRVGGELDERGLRMEIVA